MSANVRVHAAQTAFVLVLLACWQLASSLHLADPSVLPAPLGVASAAGRLLATPSFISDGLITSARVALAFLIGAPLALLAGFALGENVTLGKTIGPLFNLVLAVPQSIFLPIFVLLLGLGITEKVVFGITHVFFVVAINTMAAVREVPHGYTVAARSWGASRARIFREIYLPAMAPQVMTGLRFGLIFDIIGVLLAEMYASQDGIGLQLSRWADAMAVDKLMAATLLISVVTIVVNEMFRTWESRVSRWQRAAENA
jgi:ABC-type nitrate/sulfonate/bicarbonate transport system permease component